MAVSGVLFYLGTLGGKTMPLIPAFEIGIWNAWIFTIWLLIQNVAIRLVSKELYDRGGQPSDIKPCHIYKIIGYMSMPLWLLSTVYSVFLPLQLGTLWFYIGLAIFIFGLILNVIATVNFATTPMNEPITTGMYRYSRHPIYLALVIIYFSVGIASASWVFLLITILWVGMLHFSMIGEERYCIEKYGIRYSEYLKRTPRWIGIPKEVIK